MKAFKIFIFCIILLLLFAPVVQLKVKVVSEAPLGGYYTKIEKPSLKLLTLQGWFSGSFQDTLAFRVNSHLGLRNSLIRINNQYDYTLFGLIHADGFVRGKGGMLYEEDYIHEYNGDFFIGQRTIDKKLVRLKNVIDSLKSHGIPLILVYEPGKASFFPEYIPARFRISKSDLAFTNYGYYLKRSRELGIPFIDLNRYFLMLKEHSPFPLFPKFGMHWSLYAVPIAVDTLVKAIEAATGAKLPEFIAWINEGSAESPSSSFVPHPFVPRPSSPVPSSLVPSSPVPSSPNGPPLGTDNDIGQLLNLVCQPKRTNEGYPVIAFDTVTPRNIDALVIADSYYVNIVDTFGQNLFRKQDYWYYNRKLYPYQNDNPPTYVDKSDLRSKLLGYQVILLMVSEINLHCGFWNFADEAWQAFHPSEPDPWIYNIENDIRNEREWFRFMVRKARLEQCSLEELILTDAKYTFFSNYEQYPRRSRLDSIYHIAGAIKNSPEWSEVVRKKAVERKIPLDSMVMIDAIYTYEEQRKAR